MRLPMLSIGEVMITNVPLTALNQALVQRMHLLRVHALLAKPAQSSAAGIPQVDEECIPTPRKPRPKRTSGFTDAMEQESWPGSARGAIPATSNAA